MASTSEEECDDLTTCSVCYNKYDSVEHRPKFLPCAHTFCVICIKSLSSTSYYLTCPLCKRRLKVANKDLDAEAFPNNRFALELIKLTSERKVQNCWCVTCGAEAKASCDGAHTIIDIKEEVDAMKGQTKEVITNLVEAIGKRQQVQQTLQVRLDDLKMKVALTEIQMSKNEKHLKNLDAHLGECKNMTHLNPGKKAVLTIMSKLANSLNSAKKEVELATELHLKEVKDSVKQKATISGFIANRRKRPRTAHGSVEHAASVATSIRSNVSTTNGDVSQSHVGESSTMPIANPLLSRSELSQSITPVVKNCPGANPGDEIVGVAFNPIKPLLACVLETGIVAGFSSDNYSNPFSSWNSKIYNTKVEFPNSKIIGWNASGSHLAVGTRLLTGLVVILSEDDLQTVNIEGPAEMTSVMSLLRWNPSSPHYFVAACGGLALLANIVEGRCAQEYRFHTNDIMGMDWISTQVFATCSVDGNIYFFEIGQESPIRTLDCGGSVNSICWDSGMNLLSSCDSEGIIKLWPMASEVDQPQKQLDALGPVKYMEWSSAPPPLEGSLLASCPVAGSVSVWDTRTYTLVTPNLSGQASRLSFSPNGKYLFIAASTETEQFFKVWTTNTWEAIYFGNLTTCSPIPKVSWCPSSKKLVLKGDRHQVMVIELE